MKKIKLPNSRIVWVDGTTLDNSTVMVCREFTDPRSRRWCVMERNPGKPGDNWDAWTNIGDCATKREAVALVATLAQEAADQRAEDEAVYYRNLGI